MGDFKLVKLIDPAVVLNMTGGINVKGEYSASTTYALGDLVSYNGSSYVAIQSTTGNVPTNISYWQLSAAKGADGAVGPAGPQGDVGPAGADGVGVPPGGTTNQVLTKNSDTDYDTHWVDDDTGDFFQFNTATTATNAVGRARWNDTDGTLDIGLKGGNVVLQVGQEQLARVVNKTGADLLESNYQAVRFDGAQGQRPKVALAQADSDAHSVDTIGLVTETISVNQEGFITISGLVNGIDTTGSLQGETWQDGDTLYLSGTTAGAVTNVKPSAPIHTITVGYVIYAHGTQGRIFVNVSNGYELDELHNVSITTPTNGEVLTYETSSGLWKNKTGGTSDHESLTGLQGGTTGQHVHLTTAEYQYLYGQMPSHTQDAPFPLYITSPSTANPDVPAYYTLLTFVGNGSTSVAMSFAGSWSALPNGTVIRLLERNGDPALIQLSQMADGVFPQSINFTNITSLSEITTIGFYQIIATQEVYFFMEPNTYVELTSVAGSAVTVHVQDYLNWMNGQLAWSKVDKTGAVASDVGAVSDSTAIAYAIALG